MSKRTASVLAAVALVLWGLGTLWNYKWFNRDDEITRRWEPDVVALPRPEVARALSLGFRSALADGYWIAALNYFGYLKNQKIAYAQLADYLDIVIELDPDFHEVYKFAGMAVPWNTPTGWKNVDQAIDILKRGLARFPDDWEMHMLLAFDYSDILGKYKEAGDVLAAGAKVPGAPPLLGRLATRMYVTEGQTETALEMAEQIMNASSDASVRKAMQVRVQQLRTKRELEILQGAVQRFAQQSGHNPGALSDLVAAGLLPGIPEHDALGGEYQYDAKTGQVRSSALKDPLTVFRGPHGKPAPHGH